MLPRPYQGISDQPAMLSLARQYADDLLHVIDLPYRFSSWTLDDPGNARLWFNPRGDLVAWAVLQTPFWCIDWAVRPTDESRLLPQVLGWAEQRIHQVADTPYGHHSWYVNLFERQTAQIAVLEQAGFTNQVHAGEESWSKVWMSMSAAEPVPQCKLPQGFSLRPLAGSGEVSAYVALHREVFGTPNMTEAWRQRTLQQPGYQPELDLVACAPDGSLAAFCILWLSPHLSQGETWGQVEPMGVKAQFRGLGLGKALLSEGLRRLARIGAGRIFVETDSYRNAAFALYESVGFKVQDTVLVFGKNYPDVG